MDTTTAGITLPLAFSRKSPASILEAHVYVSACVKFLASTLVSSLLEYHPNDIAIHGPRQEWELWWKWAAAGKARWKLLIPGWGSDSPNTRSDVPDELKRMLETVDQLTLPRTLNLNLTPQGHTPLRGMSLKKAHEVSQMSAFIQSVLSRLETDIRHVVDIGAGQGYLSRALASFPISRHVIALDSSEVQTKGAERRSSTIQKKLAKTALKSGAEYYPSDMLGNLHTRESGGPPSMSPVTNGFLTHEVISITPQTLHSSVSRWISGQSTCQTTPVMLVALHACGTLTPDILRCFLANQDPHKSWYAAALVVVGCCYNLMSPDSDFPLSELVSKELMNQEDKLHLSYHHRSLAAQSPLQWSLNDSAKAAAELALRKVVYRALFGKLASSFIPGRPVKVGRLRGSSYSSLEVFISEASKKSDIQVSLPVDEEPVELISCLEALHVLRSRIGPVIESLIIVDRYLYLAENTHDSDVLAFNLFEQETGSSRNSALAVLPHEARRNM